MTTVIARTATRLAVPIALLTAIALFLQGHNLPGGGFIAGVLSAAAIALVYVVFGLEEFAILAGAGTDGPFGHAPVAVYRTLLGVGLAVAVAAGLTPIVFGQAFLAQTFRVFPGVPLYGHVEVATAVAFDLGVFLTVVGALLTIVAVVGTE